MPDGRATSNRVQHDGACWCEAHPETEVCPLTCIPDAHVTASPIFTAYLVWWVPDIGERALVNVYASVERAKAEVAKIEADGRHGYAQSVPVFE